RRGQFKLLVRLGGIARRVGREQHRELAARGGAGSRSGSLLALLALLGAGGQDRCNDDETYGRDARSEAHHVGLADGACTAGGGGGGVWRGAAGRGRRVTRASERIARVRSAKDLPTVSGGRSSQFSHASARPNTALTMVRSSSSDVGLNSTRTSRPFTAT